MKAEKVGLTPTDVFNTLQVYLGSQYDCLRHVSSLLRVAATVRLLILERAVSRRGENWSSCPVTDLGTHPFAPALLDAVAKCIDN